MTRDVSFLLIVVLLGAFALPAVAQPRSESGSTAPSSDVLETQDDADDEEGKDEEEIEPPSELETLLSRARDMFLRLPQRGDARTERLIECEGLFDEIVRGFPDAPEVSHALFYRSDCQRLLKRFELAAAGYEETKTRSFTAAKPKADEDDGDAETDWLITPAKIGLALGECYRGLHEWDRALGTYQAAYKEDLESFERPDCMYWAGICLRELGRFDDAKALWGELQAKYAGTKMANRSQSDSGSLRPPIERLKPLVVEFEEQWASYRKLPFKQKKSGERQVQVVLAKIGDVRCSATEMFLLQKFSAQGGAEKQWFVKPLLSAGGSDAARALLDTLDKVSAAVQREILGGIQRFHMKGNSVAPVAALLNRRSASTTPALEFLGRMGTLNAAKLMVSTVVEVNAKKGVDPATRTLNGTVARMLRQLTDKEAWSYLVEDVLEGARTPVTRRRIVAEALGYARVAGAAEVLEKYLSHKDSALASTCASSLGRLRVQDAVPSLAKQIQKRLRDESFVRAAVEALGRLDPTPAEGVLAVLTANRSVPVRTLAVRALGKIDSPTAKAKVIEALADPAWQVRKSALHACQAFPSVPLVDALVERMKKEDGALLLDIVKLLITFTGVDRGPNPLIWEEYWLVARDTWDAASVAGVSKKRKGSLTFVKKASTKGAESPTYFGVEIISKRVAFIIDVSGSMSGPVKVEKEGGGSDQTTKIELAKNELIGAIKKLRKGTHFNIVRFSTGYSSMAKKLQKLSKKSVKQALQFARGLGAGGGTNIFDSLEFTLEAGQVDTIFLLSDGAPSAGKFTDTTRILEEIARLNATSQVTIHTIAVGFDSELMRRLAEQNDGNYIVVGGR